jgi:hypothetical protein
MFTSSCAVYASEKDASPEELDMKNKAFWERLSVNLIKAKSMLEEAAQRHGLNIDILQNEMEKSNQKEEEIRIESRNHPLHKMSMEYSEIARQWLKTQPGMLDRLDLLKEELTLGTQSQEVAKEATVVIKDSLAVIQWYSTLIPAKIMRALSGKLHDGFSEDEEDQRDYDGSAKIALLGIDRSTQAWVSLFELLPEQEDDFLKVLSVLEKMKKMTAAEFPKAMLFSRPGFDENSD